MRRYSPSYHSPPRRGYGGSPPRRGYGGSPPRRGYDGRGRSPPRRKVGGYGGGRQNGGSLLVRNIPLNCRVEDLRVPFERFGRVRDVYLPKDYYSGEPRGFAFVEFVDPYDASEAQYHMNRQRFGGNEITVVVAAETRKRPDDMRHRTRDGGPSRDDRHRSSRYGRSRSRSRSRSDHRPSSGVRRASRSYSPAPRRQDDYSASPRGRHSARSRSPREYPEGRDEEYKRRSYSPEARNRADSGYEKARHDDEGRRGDPRSPPPGPRASRSPSGSRSRSADVSPGHSI